MSSDAELERRLQQLSDKVAQRPSMADEVMRRIEHATIAPAPSARNRRSRFMQSRILKWATPVGIAAAAVLMVGLWPREAGQTGSRGSGYVYGMSDVPQLLKTARTLHFKIATSQSDPNQPDKAPVTLAGEAWFDLENGRSCVWRPVGPHCSNAAELGILETTCDGQYVKEEYDSRAPGGVCTKGVRFKKLTAFQSLLKTREDIFFQLFNSVHEVTGFSVTGQEHRDGMMFNIWEGPIGPFGGKLKVWLSPSTGQMCRVQMNGPSSMPSMDFDEIQRDLPIPDELFSTAARPGFKPQNTKETAPLGVLGCDRIEDVMPYALRQHISFTLSDGCVLLAWSVWDKQNPNQEAVFKALQPGGDLPQLPACVWSLSPAPAEENIQYVGRHLAFTVLKGHCVEWSLYVPKQSPPRPGSILTYACDVRYQVGKDKFGSYFEGLSPGLAVQSAHDFDKWVRGAMEDLSDGGVVPPITFESTASLCKSIRAELASK